MVVLLSLVERVVLVKFRLGGGNPVIGYGNYFNMVE